LVVIPTSPPPPSKCPPLVSAFLDSGLFFRWSLLELIPFFQNYPHLTNCPLELFHTLPPLVISVPSPRNAGLRWFPCLFDFPIFRPPFFQISVSRITFGGDRVLRLFVPCFYPTSSHPCPVSIRDFSVSTGEPLFFAFGASFFHFQVPPTGPRARNSNYCGVQTYFSGPSSPTEIYGPLIA